MLMLLGKDKMLMRKLITNENILIWLYVNVSCQYKNVDSCVCILVYYI